jgi:hypothetical protein
LVHRLGTTQRVAKLGPQPGLDRCHIAGGDDKHSLIRAGPEEGDRDGGAGFHHVAQVVVEFDVTAAYYRGPALWWGRARRDHPARSRSAARRRSGLLFYGELSTGPCSGQ